MELKTLVDTIKAAYPPKAGRTNFSSIDNGTPSLYTGSDDQGTTYYFSGERGWGGGMGYGTVRGWTKREIKSGV